MNLLDFLVIGLYFAGMLAIGRYYSKRTETADEYHLGGRRMSPLLIGLSLFATLTSTLTYLALPGEMVLSGPMIFAQFLSFPLVYLVVGWVLIPAIMKQPVTSGYELLEARMGLTGRLLGAGVFVLLRTIWMAAILYATSSVVLFPLIQPVLKPVVEIDESWIPWMSAAMALVTVIYTAEGGMRAVVMTDTAQSLIMFAGSIFLVIVVSVRLGGVGAWWPTRWDSRWAEPVFGLDPTRRVTFLNAVLNMFVWMTCTAGSDQMAIQRYLSTRDVRAARRSFGINLCAIIFSAVLLALVGLAVLGYFNAHPGEFDPNTRIDRRSDELLPGERGADTLLPQLIVIGLPVGLTGLVLAALLSAAMSSLSSGLNSTSAVVVEDFVRRFRERDLNQAEQVRLARRVSVLVGVVAFGLSLVIPLYAVGLFDLCIKVVNLLTVPLFVLFFLALFVPFATPLGGLLGTAASVCVASGIGFFKLGGLTMLWMAPAALVAGTVVGTLASLLPFGNRPAANLRTPHATKQDQGEAQA